MLICELIPGHIIELIGQIGHMHTGPIGLIGLICILTPVLMQVLIYGPIEFIILVFKIFKIRRPLVTRTLHHLGLTVIRVYMYPDSGTTGVVPSRLSNEC